MFYGKAKIMENGENVWKKLAIPPWRLQQALP
jgi:hypothetical protein